MSDRPQSLMSMDDRRKLPLHSVNMVVYSWPGVGKTPFWGSGGETLLLMDSDHGLESAMASNSKADVVDVIDHETLTEVYSYLRYSDEAKKKYRWVSWDSLTLFMDRSLIDDVLADAAAANPKQSPDVASQREYLVQQNRIGTKVRDFVSLPYNFGISCHVWSIEKPGDEDGGLIWAPMIEGGKGKFCTKVMGYMNVIAYMGVKKDRKTRRLITGNSNNYITRDRFGALKTGEHCWIDDPTVPKIDTLIREKLASGQDRNQSPKRSRRSRPVVR